MNKSEATKRSRDRKENGKCTKVGFDDSYGGHILLENRHKKMPSVCNLVLSFIFCTAFNEGYIATGGSFRVENSAGAG